MNRFGKRLSVLLLSGALLLGGCTPGKTAASEEVSVRNITPEVQGTETSEKPSEVSSRTEVKEEMLPAMDAKYHALIDGEIYYREYVKEDLADPVYTYFSTPFMENTEGLREHKICRMSSNGSTEVAFTNDTGFGAIYAADGRLFSQEGCEGECDHRAYRIDTDGGNKTLLENYKEVLGAKDDRVIVLAGYHEEEGYDNEVCIIDADTLTELAAVEGTYLGSDERYVYTYTKANNGSIGENLFASFYATDYNGRTIHLGDTTKEMFLNNPAYNSDIYELATLDIYGFQILSDIVVFNIGYSAGTGHFFQGGILCYAFKDGSGLYYICSTETEAFYCTERDDAITAFTYQYDEEVMDSVVTAFSIAGGTDELKDYSYQYMGIPYESYSGFATEDGRQFGRGDISIYADASGELTALLYEKEYEGFGYTPSSSDMEAGSDFEIYNVEYVGNHLFFTVSGMERMEEEDIGWRYAWRHSRTADFVKNLETGKVDMLAEYGPDVE